MYPKICFFLTTLLIIFFAGCKKNNEDPVLQVFVTKSFGGIIREELVYIYDQNKILKSKKEENTWNAAGKVAYEYTYFYTAAGFIDSIAMKWQTQPGSAFVHTGYKYFYNASNALLYQVQSSRNSNTGKIEPVDSTFYVTDALKRVICLKHYSFVFFGGAIFLTDSTTYDYDAKGNMILQKGFARNRPSDPFLMRFKNENQYDDKPTAFYPQQGAFDNNPALTGYPSVNNVTSGSRTGYTNTNPPSVSWQSLYTTTITYGADNRPVKSVRNYGPTFSEEVEEYSYR